MGLNGLIPIGGQVFPISIFGDRLLWKYAQKNLIKNKISDTINKIMPHRKPVSTNLVWHPWKVLSRITSRHHWIIVKIKIKYPNRRSELLNLWNQFTNPHIKIIAPNDPVSGHGLLSTKWNGWLNVDINKFL